MLSSAAGAINLSERRNLGDKAGIVVVARVIVAVAQMGTAVALVRLLPKEEFAVVTYLLLLYQTVSTLAMCGLPQGLLYFLPRLDAAARKIFVLVTTVLLGGFGLAGSLLLLALGGWGGLVAASVPGALPLLPFIALYIVLDLPTQAATNLLIALDRVELSARINLAFSLITVAGLLIPTALGLPLDRMMAIFTATAAIRLAVYLVVARRLVVRGVPGQFRDTPWREQLRSLLRFAVPLGMTSSVGMLGQQIDKYLVSLAFSTTAYAEYAAGAQEVPLVAVLPYTVATVLMPTFVEHWTAGRSREMLAVWHASILKVALVMLPAGVLLFICAEEYVTLFFTRNYAPAAGPARIYVLLLALRVTAFGVILQALGDTRAVFIVAIVSLLLNALASAAFIAWFGLLGAPAAAVAVQFVGVAMMLAIIARHTGVRLANLFPWRGYVSILGLALLAAPVAVVLRPLFPSSAAASLGIAAAGYFASFFVLASWADVITSGDRAWLAHRLLRRRPAAS